jgi:hypothetical protein
MTTKGQQYLFSQDVVQPAQVAEYEGAMQELRTALVQYQFQVPLEIMQMNNQVFYVMSPIDTLDAIDAISRSFSDLAEKIGLEEYLTTLERSFATMYYQNHAVVYRHVALSLWPDSQRPAFGEQPYVNWRVFSVHPEKNQEALEIYGQIMAWQKKKEIPCNYDFYTLTIGPEMPAFMVVHHARHAADFHMRLSQAAELMGPKGEELHQHLALTLRRTEEYSGWERTDLSYLPE